MDVHSTDTDHKACRNADRKERLRSYRRWLKNSLTDGFGWKNLDKEARCGRLVRDVTIVLMAAISVFLYWICFLDRNVPDSVNMIIFIFYLMPIAVVSVLYGWFGGIICFTPIFIFALILSPSNAYFLFYHLIAVYVFSIINTRDFCRNFWRTILTGVISGFLMSLFYYVIFILVTSEAFSQTSVSSLVLHIANIMPETILICLFIYLFNHKCGNRIKQVFGYKEKVGHRFADMISRSIKVGYRALSGKIFALLLVEAVFMGVSAAFFANSLIPKMMEHYHEQTEATMSEDMNSSADDSSDTHNPPLPEEIKPPAGDWIPQFMGTDEFSEAFDTARLQEGHDRFAFDDQGIAFDLKLIMMLLCVIHPIVLLANYIGQKLIAWPIVKMTNIMDEFGDDPDQRLLVAEELDKLNIHSEDEIEALFGVVKGMVNELNSYIDEIRREQQLKEDLRVAEAASEAKSNFLSNVSHEIRTPINAVLGLDEMILRESDDKNILKYAVDIKNSGKTLLSLINDLLDFSKIEAGKMEIIPVEYELSSAINDLINMVSTKAADKGLELIIDVDHDIPHLLYGDEIRIKQCILNILNNAVKYTHKGSVKMSISGRRDSDDEITLRISVEDTGIGIKDEDLDKLCSPFERIEESRNRTIEGTGLGMSIVTQLLGMMDSKLEVSSVYGEGSVFSFEVAQKVINWDPIGDFNDTYLKSLDSLKKYSVSFIAPDATILVVDDTPMNLTVIKGLLKPTRVKVDTATGGAECIDRVKKCAYDLIFMDQRMPEMDGTETLHALKEMGADENQSYEAPVIVLTANVVAGAREGFISEGFDDYLSKPIDAAKLEKMIASYLPKEKILEPDEDGSADGGDDSDTRSSTDTEDELVAALRDIEGIDADAALTNCMTSEILSGAVHDFTVALKTEPDKIEGLWKSGDIRNYTIAVHALKSSSRLIGALELSSLAAKLEEMGDAGDISGINEHTPEMLDMYRGFYDKLINVGSSGEQGEEIEPDQLNDAYAAIREAVSAFDYDTADEVVNMLREYRIPEAEKTRFERICDLVTALDRDALLEEL